MGDNRWCRGVAIGVIASVLFACSGSDRLPDSAVLTSCADLENEVLTASMLRGTCDSDADCMLIAGEQVQSCDCTPYLIDCGGVPIERNAPGLAHALAAQRAFFDRHCDLDAARSQACDCVSRGPMRCDANHRCTANMRSCGMAPAVDAAVDAPPPNPAAP